MIDVVEIKKTELHDEYGIYGLYVAGELLIAFNLNDISNFTFDLIRVSHTAYAVYDGKNVIGILE